MNREEAVQAVTAGLKLIDRPDAEQTPILLRAYEGLTWLSISEGPETKRQAMKLIDVVEQDALNLRSH